MNNKDYQKEEEEELQKGMLNEPSPNYHSLSDRPIPPHIMRDIERGMEQYERGEYMDMDEFMESLKQRYQ